LHQGRERLGLLEGEHFRVMRQHFQALRQLAGRGGR
jgi:hypothetical protein